MTNRQMPKNDPTQVAVMQTKIAMIISRWSCERKGEHSRSQVGRRTGRTSPGRPKFRCVMMRPVVEFPNADAYEYLSEYERGNCVHCVVNSEQNYTLRVLSVSLCSCACDGGMT